MIKYALTDPSLLTRIKGELIDSMDFRRMNNRDAPTLDHKAALGF